MKYLMMLSALGLVGCSVYSPDAGHEIVLIEKPWIFGHGGVDSDPVKPGRTFAAITTEGVDVYMQPQKFDTEMHDTMTSDGVPISFHAIVVLQVTDSVVLIKNFGPNWYQNNLEEQFKTMVRQAVDGLGCCRCGDSRRFEGIHQGKGIADPACHDDCRASQSA